ncbi:uncharacterized protein [Rutidosis leptorrhynchoides]|uniref:uncharacterized protein n=1 Tax=Rutidosis leptorrhynchoides TaxID=125765 RepID=UPI003A99F3E8
MANNNNNTNSNQFPTENENEFPNSFMHLLNHGASSNPNFGASSSNPNAQPYPNFSNYFPGQRLNEMQQQQLMQQQQFQLQNFNLQHMLHQQAMQAQQQNQYQHMLQQQSQPQRQSQQEQSQSQAPDTPTRKKRSHKKKIGGVSKKEIYKKKMWDPEEEAWLATCWIDSSEDSKKGNSQKISTLWNTIYEKFNNNERGWYRGDDQLTSKWRNVNRACKDFNGFYEDVKRNWRSGQNDEGIMKKALLIYKREKLKDFNMVQAWDVLKKHPKWYAPPPFGGEDEGDDDDDDDDNDVEEGFNDSFHVDLSDSRPIEKELFGSDRLQRPQGRDKAKKAAKRSVSSDAGTASRSTNSSKSSKYSEKKRRKKVHHSRLFEMRLTYNKPRKGFKFLKRICTG